MVLMNGLPARFYAMIPHTAVQAFSRRVSAEPCRRAVFGIPP